MFSQDLSSESKADKTADSSDTDKQAGLVAGDSSMEIPEGMTEEQYKALMEQSGASDTGELADMGMNAMGSMDMSAIQGGDMSSLTETQKKYIASLSDEQMELMKQMLKEQSDTNADQLANSGSSGHIAAVTFDGLVLRGSGSQGHAVHIVDDLGIDVGLAAENVETGAHGSAGDLSANTLMTLHALLIGIRSSNHFGTPPYFLAPVLPTLRRMTSSVYLMPLPL